MADKLTRQRSRATRLTPKPPLSPPYKKTPPRARALDLAACASVSRHMVVAVRAHGGIPTTDYDAAARFGAAVIRSLTKQFGFVDDMLASFLNHPLSILQAFQKIGGYHPDQLLAVP